MGTTCSGGREPEEMEEVGDRGGQREAKRSRCGDDIGTSTTRGTHTTSSKIRIVMGVAAVRVFKPWQSFY
jgi:hypothetical protein